MTIGQWLCGNFGAGADMLTFGGKTPPMSANPQYDPQLRVIVINANGTIAAVNYVDEMVAFALTVKLGTIPAAPTIGIDWDAMRRATAANMLNVVAGCV